MAGDACWENSRRVETPDPARHSHRPGPGSEVSSPRDEGLVLGDPTGEDPPSGQGWASLSRWEAAWTEGCPHAQALSVPSWNGHVTLYPWNLLRFHSSRPCSGFGSAVSF